MSVESINLGIFAFNTADPLPSERTLVVLGIARGGTSFVASTLVHLGIPFDLSPPNYDNPELSTAIRAEDWDSYRRQIETMDSRYPVWGTKIMANHTRTAHALSMIRNPFLLCIFRDPCAVAVRKQMVGKDNYAGISSGVKATLRQYIRLVEVVTSLSACPTMFISYGNALQNMRTYIAAVNDFVGKPVPDISAERMAAIAASVQGEGGKYRRAKTRKASRLAARQKQAEAEKRRLARKETRAAERKRRRREHQAAASETCN